MNLPLFDEFDDAIQIPHVLQESVGKSLQVDNKIFSLPEIDLGFYDLIIVSMSGGKDSIAALLRLIDMGVDLSKVELWHNLVDGNEGKIFMDWKYMDSYNKKLAEAFKLPLYNSWLEHGFEGEMLKNNSRSHRHMVETPDGLLVLDRKQSKDGTRLKYPQQAANLLTRWCSSALKIDVGRRALNNQERLLGKKILFVTGERREESSNRAKYFQMETHLCDCRYGEKARYVDSYRPVLEFSEKEVWEIMERYHVAPPVPYRLGWSRSSCMTCIYNSPKVWASIKHYFPERIEQIVGYENQFGVTISRKKLNVVDISEGIEPFDIQDLEALEQAHRTEYTLPVFTKDWVLPMGAFGEEGCGST